MAGLLLAVALVALMLVSVVQREPPATAGTPIAALRESAPDPTLSPPALGAAVEPAESLPPVNSATSTADTVTVPVQRPSPAAVEKAVGEVEPRYASTWVNVRGARSGTAPVIRVLGPGDPIRVDSLRQGWYRVLADGQTLGYVDRNFVSPNPEPDPR